MEELIRQLEDETIKCVRCGFCRIDCPTFLQTKAESASTRGMIYIINALAGGEVEPTDEYARKLYTCASENVCVPTCPVGVLMYRIMPKARYQLLSMRDISELKGVIFADASRSPERVAFFQEVVDRNLDSGSIWDKVLPISDVRLKFSSLDDLPEEVQAEDERFKVGYFVGCADSMVFSDVAVATLNLLKVNGVSADVPKAQRCCGNPFWTLGDLDSARKLAQSNIKSFKGYDYVVTSCATCAFALKEYPDLLGTEEAEEFAAKVYESSQFLVDVVGNVKVKGKINGKVTYHDPTPLSKVLKVTDQPRKLLVDAYGDRFVEMETATEFCGGSESQMFAVRYYEWATEMAGRTLSGVDDTGAQVLATSCPHCQYQLTRAAMREGKSLKALRVVQLVGG